MDQKGQIMVTTPAAKTRTRKPAAPKPTLETKTVSQQEEKHAIYRELTEDQRQAKIQAYAALKGAGLEIPTEISADVEIWIAEEEVRRAEEEASVRALQEAYEEENAKGPWYVRNLYPAPQSLRLDRQEDGKRRIELKPRGVPGDMHPLLEDDLKDPILTLNLNQGLIEVIPAGEAKLIIEKQVTNVQNRVHTPLNILRNAKGEAYESPNPVKVEVEYGQQGVVVASLDPRVNSGQLTDKEIGQVSRLEATRTTVSGFVPTGGNPAIISDGFAAINDKNAAARIADDIARRKGAGGIEAGIGNLTVTVAPTQKG
jgi:hypothetical protein